MVSLCVFIVSPLKMCVAGLPLYQWLWRWFSVPHSQRTLFAAGKSLERGAASVSSCDSNPCLFSISKHGRFALVTQGQYFRRKLPSLIQRDLERSKLQNEQSAKADQAGGKNFHFPFFYFPLTNTNGLTLKLT